MSRFLSLALALLIALGSSLSTAPTPPVSAAQEGFAFGVIVDTTDTRSMQAAREAGFTHAKMMLHWAHVEPSPGNYLWNSTRENDFDNIMKTARREEMKLVVRVDGVPGWAGGSPANANLDAVQRFYEEAARYGADTVAAFEILNEPNLDREWGGAPDAGAYTRFMKAAFRGVKAGNPDALVLGGGPAPGTGNHPGATIEDIDFINGMYDAGAKGHMDALAVHNYGGNTAPERDPSSCGICFRRAELYRDVMVRRGDSATPIWLTEWGYLLDAGQHMGQYDWMKVSERQQAEFIVGAHRYAQQNWPWLTGSLLYNIDGATSPYQNYGGFDAKAWFSLLNSDYSPRAAFTAFQQYREPAILAARQEAERKAAEAAAAARAAELAKQQAAAAAEQPSPSPAAEPTETDPLAAAPETPTQPSGDRLRVVGTDGTGVNLRSAPSLTASRIKTIPEGAVLVATGETRQSEGHTWHSVADASGLKGWVSAQFVASI